MDDMDLSADAFSAACREGGRQIESWLRVIDREHGARFYREAAAALKCWQEAEDVVQEAMVKVWLRCASFRGAGDPIAWIHQIVRNTLLDALEKRRPQQPLLDDNGELTLEVQSIVTQLSEAIIPRPEQQLAEHQLEHVFRSCFDRFSMDYPLHATVLRWIVDEGLDNAEIERLLDRSPGATREFISQCRKKARPYFREWHALVAAGEADSLEGVQR